MLEHQDALTDALKSVGKDKDDDHSKISIHISRYAEDMGLSQENLALMFEKELTPKIMEKLPVGALTDLKEVYERARRAERLRYDTSPVAKAIAATVLASKLGAEAGLKVFLGDDSAQHVPFGKSNDVEPMQSSGLRNRKQAQTRPTSPGGTVMRHSAGASLTLCNGIMFKVKDVLLEIRPHFSENQLLVSVVAGTKLKDEGERITN
ncbi:uncharacterized protein LOC141628784 [Silene latifolia]|uniref:uncharacterized protein LOC141628784 n=1 Tax=Silene latifolia TaxID=37657 RepID=UPI003D78700F